MTTEDRIAMGLLAGALTASLIENFRLVRKNHELVDSNTELVQGHTEAIDVMTRALYSADYLERKLEENGIALDEFDQMVLADPPNAIKILNIENGDEPQ